MPTGKSEVESILRSDAFTASTLRELVRDKRLDVNKVRTEDMIGALLRHNWSEDEIERLKDQLEELQREKQTMGYYVAKLEGLPDTTQQPRHKELREALLIDEVERTEEEIERKGFEIKSVSSDEVTAIYWTQTKNWEINSLGNLTSRQRTYDIGVEVHLTDGWVHLFVDNFGKMSEVRSAVEDVGIELGEIGHSSLSRRNANETVRRFVESLEAGLEQKRKQLSIQTFSDDEHGENVDKLLRVKEVNIDIGDGDVKTADLEGKQDIFTDDTVRDLVENRDGRITGLKGVMSLGEIDFRINAGSPGEIGRVSVRKKSSDGGVEELSEAFEFLYDNYHNYFLECEQ